MAIAAEEIGASGEVTPEIGGEYQRLVGGGAAPGRDTMQLARSNVAGRAAKPAPAKSTAAPSPSSSRKRAGSGGGGAAGGPLLQRARGAHRQLAGAAAGAASSVSTPSRTASTVTKLIWALALGFAALEVVSEATGQKWSFSLPGKQTFTKQAYKPLYSGQAVGEVGTALGLPGVAGAVAGAAGSVPILPTLPRSTGPVLETLRKP